MDSVHVNIIIPSLSCTHFNQEFQGFYHLLAGIIMHPENFKIHKTNKDEK